MKPKFIKIFDEKIAGALAAGGFSYMEEKVNGDQQIYCFEESRDIVEAIRELCARANYQEAIIIVQDDSLLF